MPRHMLIDAAHPEETRVVVLDNGRLDEFDFESAQRKQLRGNIYLAKVTRVEPSLQAAFIEYGGNRHGFLAFNEIHPDYYQIPHADREALMREARADGGDDDHPPPPPAPPNGGDEDSEAALAAGDEEDEIDEDIARQRRRLMRRYKIQEVIKRRQIMLVQVVKEERGNKGAALTTYLSLAGRYCVLMPNTDRGGGISRKITAAADRKRLREVVAEFDVPQGMGLIVRTAGAKRTRAEIRRDYEYLSRAWSNIRDTTLRSIAPALIYEEEDLVKRAIRDLFDKDVEAIWVDGEAGFREARDFMRMLTPSQAKKVQPWREGTPLFMARKVEDHLAQIYSSTVPLKSGGYLVINQTEALVAIDVNSGRATRERNIEATALRTNLEAAEEAARQLRLRDLAGLIVIDFIDMDEAKNNRAVEKVLKDCIARDRARIQTGRISPFGLMEISRQRRRTGILEGTTDICPHCQGAGRVRSVESSALAALRAVEMEAVRGGGETRLTLAKDVGLYILNHKREYLLRLAHRQGLYVTVALDEVLGHADHQIERLSDTPYVAKSTDEALAGPAALGPEPASDATMIDEIAGDDVEDDGNEDEDEDEDEAEIAARAPNGPGEANAATRPAPRERGDGPNGGGFDGEPGRRRRRRRRGRGDDARRAEEARPPEDPGSALADPVREVGALAESEAGGGRRRRRGRRGGRAGRDETRAADPYGWSWPARLSGEDTYEWRGPVGAAAAAGDGDVAATPARPGPAGVEARAATAAATHAEAADEPPRLDIEASDFWVELPTAEERPRRRSRGRGRGDLATTEPANGAESRATPSPDPGRINGAAAAEAEPERELEPALAASAPVEPVSPQSPQAPPAALADGGRAPITVDVEAAAEQPRGLAPEPPPMAAAAAEPDPAEISTSPASRRRGWWRGPA